MDKNIIWYVFKLAVLAFLGMILVLSGIWYKSLFIRIDILQTKIEETSKYIERAERTQNENRSFINDVLAYKAASLCFKDLIEEYKEKYSNEGINSCVRNIMIADERYRDKGLDVPLILAWLEKESGGNPEAVSYAGAMGLTQLMDFNAEKIFFAMGYTGSQRNLAFRPEVNLEGGIYHINTLINFWENKGIHNKILVLFYSLHSYKWGIKNTFQLFNSGKRAYRPAIEYVNWILNRREYWVNKLEYYKKNYNNYLKEGKGRKVHETIFTELLQ